MSPGLFIWHDGGEPSFNQAFDEWMFGSALAVPGLLIARLYTWSPGAITFGRNQREDSALNWTKVGETPVIRRVTGGRAVYHDPDELTYALVVNPHAPERRHLAGSVARTSSLFSKALREFLQSLGLAPDIVQRSSSRDAAPDFFHKAPCFESTARHELVQGGAKVVASAQRQVQGVILQHGSIKIHGLAPHQALDLPGAPSGQRGVAGPLRPAVAAPRFVDSLNRVLGVDLQPWSLNEVCRNELAERVKEVAMRPLSKRPVVKQTALANSL